MYHINLLDMRRPRLQKPGVWTKRDWLTIGLTWVATMVGLGALLHA